METGWVSATADWPELMIVDVVEVEVVGRESGS